jgi:site-specific recombinase XerD
LFADDLSRQDRTIWLTTRRNGARRALLLKCVCRSDGLVNTKDSSWRVSVFPSRRTDSYYTLGAIEKEFRRIREALSLPSDYVPYIARHSFATSALDMTGNIQFVADTFGHADTSITSTYLHPSRRGLAALINARNEQRTNFANGTICGTIGFRRLFWRR